MSTIFLLPVCLTYCSRKYTARIDPTSVIPTKFEVDMTIHYRVIAFLSADMSRDFVTSTFDLEQLLCMAGHVTNHTTKFEDPTPRPIIS